MEIGSTSAEIKVYYISVSQLLSSPQAGGHHFGGASAAGPSCLQEFSISIQNANSPLKSALQAELHEGWPLLYLRVQPRQVGRCKIPAHWPLPGSKHLKQVHFRAQKGGGAGRKPTSLISEMCTALRAIPANSRTSVHPSEKSGLRPSPARLRRHSAKHSRAKQSVRPL